MVDSTNLTPEQLLEEVRHNPLCSNALHKIEEEYERLKGSANCRARLLERATEKISQGSRAVAGVWELADGDVTLALEQSMSELLAITEAKRNLSVIGMLMHERAMELTSDDNSSVAAKSACKGKKVKSKPQAPDSQHGIDHPVFAKGLGVMEQHFRILYVRLTQRGWISTQTNVIDFLRLFNGHANNCEVIWTGREITGKDKPRTVGKAALYVLFTTMKSEKIITCTSSKVGPILESHIVDTDGRYLTKISNDTRVSRSAREFIDDLIRTMHTQVPAEDLQRLLEEEMPSQYDRNDRQDLNWRKR